MHKKVKQKCHGAVSAREASRIVFGITIVTAVTRCYAHVQKHRNYHAAAAAKDCLLGSHFLIFNQ